MRHALDDAAVTEVDHLTGDDRYKRDWMSHRRERWGIVAFNPGTARGFMEGAANLVSNRGQQLWRRVSPARPRHRMTGSVRTMQGPRSPASFARSLTA